MRRFAVASCAALSLALAGCIQSSTLVKLQPDGSGTIEQTITMSAQAMAQLSALSAMGDQGAKDSKGAKDLSKDPFSDDDARAAAGKMGEGVSFVSSEKIDTADRKGRRAVYAFKDIRKLSLEEMNAPSGSGAGDMAPKDPPMTFKFDQLPGGHGLLTIVNAAAAKAASAPMGAQSAAAASTDANAAQAMAMMKSLMGGLKIDVAVQVGRLVKTNIPYVNGGTVTLLSMDFDKALAEPALLDRLQKAKTLADTKAALKDVKGFKVNLDPELKIEFAAK